MGGKSYPTVAVFKGFRERNPRIFQGCFPVVSCLPLPCIPRNVGKSVRPLNTAWYVGCIRSNQGWNSVLLLLSYVSPYRVLQDPKLDFRAHSLSTLDSSILFPCWVSVGLPKTRASLASCFGLLFPHDVLTMVGSRYVVPPRFSSFPPFQVPVYPCLSTHSEIVWQYHWPIANQA